MSKVFYINVNQALLGKVFLSMLTKSYQTKLLYQCLLGLIKQNPHINANKILLYRASTHNANHTSLGQVFYINIDQVFLGRSFDINLKQIFFDKVFISTLIKTHQIELLNLCQPGIIG